MAIHTQSALDLICAVVNLFFFPTVSSLPKNGSKSGNKSGMAASAVEEADEDSNLEMTCNVDEEKEEREDPELLVPHSDEDSNYSMKQAHSPRQPLDCIPVETVLHEQPLPEGTSYLSSECFGPLDNGHCESPDQSKRKCTLFHVIHHVLLRSEARFLREIMV